MDSQGSWPEDQARTTVVSLPGEISYYTAPQVHDELLAALEPGVSTVILDLTLATFFDSAGLAEITVARQLATAYHIDLRVVVPPSSPLAGFFGSSGLDRVLAIYPTLRGALTAPRGPRPGTSGAGTSGAGASGAGASGAGTRSALPPPVPGAWVAGGVTWSRSN
jgi:anti-anti-sigma factor